MTRLHKRLPALAAGLLLSTLAAAGVQAAPKPYAATGGMKVQTQTSGVRTQVLNIAKGRSAVIDLPVDAADVFVSNPAAADTVLRTPRRVFVLGVAAGQSDAIFFDGAGRQILNLQIRVGVSTDQLSDTVHQLYPQSDVEVQTVNGYIILSGVVANASESEAIQRLAIAFAEKPDNIINMLAIAGKDQVSLKVRIVEIEKSSIKQLGFNFNGLSGATGEVQYGVQNTPTYGTNGRSLGGMQIGYTDRYLAASLQAFERVGLTRTLAEPNLTAVSGEAAKFLVGGEFPIPVARDATGRITVEFKTYGVGLGFTPVVLSNGTISLKLNTEVSEITNSGAFQLDTDFTLPALSVRRAETTVELPSGGSLMIAGMLQSKYKQTVDALPGMATMPVLGALFRSRDFLDQQTELVVIVTPYIVSAKNPSVFQTPADGFQAAGDLETVFLGRINKAVRRSRGEMAETPPPAGSYQAPIGYVIE
ncbi:type II and III secretion system protein family protein [Asticcacaulis sp. AND118]|uniref:type II and III secretion system protein family protein n=1 Tax=Asticcacaulis sp. AND118 TaxID=2840468 RepID=UPI001CFF7737|nr:type II and III secretion system protein family protein [Asticcacaulis sp. AND118]UDF03748.1 type II and III secretion system protein family protein [Asticcacaulis sp. AND118]